MDQAIQSISPAAQPVPQSETPTPVSPTPVKPVKPWHKYKGRYNTKDRHKNKGRGSKSGKCNLTAERKRFLEYLPENNFSIEDTCKVIGLDVHTAYMWLQDDRFIEQHWAPQVERYLPIIEMSHMGSAATNKGVRNVLAQLHILKKRHPKYKEETGKEEKLVPTTVTINISPDITNRALLDMVAWHTQQKRVSPPQPEVIDVETDKPATSAGSLAAECTTPRQ